jgi:hypothetical protein
MSQTAGLGSLEMGVDVVSWLLISGLIWASAGFIFRCFGSVVVGPGVGPCVLVYLKESM